MKEKQFQSKPFSVKSAKIKPFSIRMAKLWMSSNSPSNELAKSFWRVESNVKITTFLKYLKLELMYGDLSVDRYQMLVDSPGFFSDKVFLEALRAKKNLLVSDKELGERFSILYQLGYYPTYFDPNLLYTLRGVVKYRYNLETFSIRKAKKFSGYVKNSSSVGSKRMNTSAKLDPEISEWTNAVSIDFFHFFSVGELDTGLPGSLKLTLTSPKGRNGD